MGFKKMRPWRPFCLLLAVLTINPFLAASCANLVQVKVDVVDQRTALENQVLGGYADIESDQTLLASVRSVGPDGSLRPAPALPESKRAAVRAMQRSRFNRDDIEEAKKNGLLGEGTDGYLHLIPAAPLGGVTPFIENLLKEENADRTTLYGRIAQVSRDFQSGEIDRVAKIMAGLHRDAAKKGEYIQADAGGWIVKEQ